MHLKLTLLFFLFLSPLSALYSTPLQDICKEIDTSITSVSEQDCLELQFSTDNYRTRLDRPFLFKTYPPSSYNAKAAKVLLMGGIHGDEYSSIAIIFKWLSLFKEENPTPFHWEIVPLLNPDGLLNKLDGQRQNANGVDINRNFPSPEWQKLAFKYWINISKKNPRRYPGPSANSELETQWFINKIKNFKPDLIVAVHAPHNLVDFNGPGTGPKSLGKLKHQLLESYPGSLGSYAGEKLNIPVITIELPYAGILPSINERFLIWDDLLNWINFNIKVD